MKRENQRFMDSATRFEQLRQRLHDSYTGIHALRLERVLSNLETHFEAHADDDRLAHLMSRVGLFARGLTDDLQAGNATLDDAIQLLDELATIGDLGLDLWSDHGSSASV